MGKIPILERDKIRLPEYPHPVCLPQMSETWQKWLEKNRSFRFEDERFGLSFTAAKDSRGYWTAQKRIQGKLYQKRLGSTEMLSKLTPAELSEVAKCLGADAPPTTQELLGEIAQLEGKMRQIKALLHQYWRVSSRTSPRWEKALRLMDELEKLL